MMRSFHVAYCCLLQAQYTTIGAVMPYFFVRLFWNTPDFCLFSVLLRDIQSYGIPNL